MKLLIAHSEPEALQLADFLRQSGFEVDVEPNGLQCADRTSLNTYDLAVINVTGRGPEAFTLLRRVRRAASLPVLMITEREDWSGRVQAFHLGADDCLPKPFRPEEVLARICAILRRNKPATEEPQAIIAGELSLCLATRKVYFRDLPVRVTAIECEILDVLMRQCGRVVSRDQLSLHLYNRPASPFDRAVDTHLSRIRRKLGEAGRLIVSVRGTGYQLCSKQPAAKRAAAENRFLRSGLSS